MATKPHPPILSIALLSACALAYEVLLTRLFSIIQWHHFAFMIISLALLGYGAGGTFLALTSRHLQMRFRDAYPINAALFGACTLICYLAAQRVPFNAQEVLWDPRQIFYLAQIYLLLALPFFFVANAIGLALMQYRDNISHLYAADMLGAGLGAALIVGLLILFFPENVLRILAAAAVAAAALAVREVNGRRKMIWVLLATAAIPLLLPPAWLKLHLSPYKGLSQALRITGTRLVHQTSGPLGLLSVVESPVIPLRHAPGLSLTARQEPPEQLGVFTDGDNLTVINHDSGDRERFAYLDELTSAAPYHLRPIRRVLVLGAGGGTEVQQARYHKATDITAVELNPQLTALLRQKYAGFCGHLYQNKSVNVQIDEARGFLAAYSKTYDLIQMALLDAFGASSAGLYALNESYLYTVEALEEYIRHLSPGGVLAITRWVKLPPRDNLKLFATAVAALRQSGIARPENRLLLIRSWQTCTLMLKKGDWRPEEIRDLKAFCRSRNFDTAYYPGIASEKITPYNQLPQPYFQKGTLALLGQDAAKYLADYKFNLQPATDDKPFFFHFFKWKSLPEILSLLGQGGMSLLESGYIVLLAALLQAVLFSGALILVPLLRLARIK